MQDELSLVLIPYRKAGLTMARGGVNDPALVRALQRDLRALGYLRGGIDGSFGPGTERAVRALQYDLMNATGASNGGDGRAPVVVADYNGSASGGRLVTAVTGVLDQPLAACIAAMFDDERFTKVSRSAEPVQANAEALAAITGQRSTIAPAPFIAAMVLQESNGQHYRVPTTQDADDFVVVGLDRNANGNADSITSRGYGIGQYTIFHHPPRLAEVHDFVLDPVANVQRAFQELRRKFDRFVLGPDSRASDRDVEHPLLPLRLCRYAPSDARYLRDCQRCAAGARRVDIAPGTPVYAGASISYRTDQYYPSARYVGVPDRADFPCDWPYAARRYNGGGMDSFHYQTRVLRNLLAGPPLAGG